MPSYHLAQLNDDRRLHEIVPAPATEPEIEIVGPLVGQGQPGGRRSMPGGTLLQHPLVAIGIAEVDE
jgi:hypothetical protein